MGIVYWALRRQRRHHRPHLLEMSCFCRVSQQHIVTTSCAHWILVRLPFYFFGFDFTLCCQPTARSNWRRTLQRFVYARTKDLASRQPCLLENNERQGWGISPMHFQLKHPASRDPIELLTIKNQFRIARLFLGYHAQLLTLAMRTRLDMSNSLYEC
jgi:hypothetical protein